MKLMCPEKQLAKLFVPLFLITLLCSVNISAQSKKASTAKKTAVKKTATSSKDAKKATSKDSKKQQTAKKTTKSESKKEKASAKTRVKDAKNSKESKQEKLTAKEKADEKRSKGRKKPTAAELRAEAEKKRAEAARRAAVIAEQRRREQAAREARARKLAFERGLRTETIANIEKDNTEGEDLAIRRAAVNALGSHAGTVVVMEAQTGKVLTIVNQDWAIRNSFKPCSTIKLVTGVGGLNEKIINDDGSIKNSSEKRDLDDALAYSSNIYFQRVGAQMGSSKMIEYAKDLGLGERTGINAEGESSGRLPYGNNNTRIYSHGDDYEVTPLQLAVMVSAISNGGKKVVPQIQRVRVEKTSLRPVVKETVGLLERVVEGVIPGMIGAAEYGTARRGVDASMGVAGKTGSCIFKGSWIGLFASVAPVEQPKYSVVVITRGQSERGKYAAAIAGKVYSALSSRLERNLDSTLARKQIKTKPELDAKTAAVDEEEDDADSPEAGSIEDAPIVVGERRSTAIAVQPAPVQKKLIHKTTSSKPTFKPVVIEFDRSGASTPKPTERPRIVKNK